jgi:hypothetical protein
MVAKGFVGANEIKDGKAMLVRIVSRLFGLIRANSDVRVFEAPPSYGLRKKAGVRIGTRVRDKLTTG